jgi:hypothetical protein
MGPDDKSVAHHDPSICDESCRHAGSGLPCHDRANGPREEGANVWQL